MERKEIRLFVPIVRCYDDADDPSAFFIEGLASDTTQDSYEGVMEPEAIYEMAGQSFSKSIIVDVEHRDGWADEIGEVVEASVLDEAPEGYEDANPPILWTKLRLDRNLSHSKDLYYLLKHKSAQIGLSIYGWLERFNLVDGVLHRIEVSWERLAITNRPANPVAWLAQLALSVREVQEGGDGSTDWRVVTNENTSESLQFTQREVTMPEGTESVGTPPENQGNDNDSRVMEAILRMSNQITSVVERMDGIETRVAELSAAPAPAPAPPVSPAIPEGLETRLASIEQMLSSHRQRRTAADLEELLLSGRSRQRGLQISGFGQPNLDSQFQAAVEAGNMDEARALFWVRLDQARGFN